MVVGETLGGIGGQPVSHLTLSEDYGRNPQFRYDLIHTVAVLTIFLLYLEMHPLLLETSKWIRNRLVSIVASFLRKRELVIFNVVR